MSIYEALKEAITLINSVEVKGTANMKRLIIAIDRIESSITALENSAKEEAAHEENHDQRRENA